jgi:site-specific recombinase XerD
MHFMEHREPRLLDQVRRILAIPTKRTEKRLIGYLTVDEIRAILNAPLLTTRLGIRDRAMIHLCYAAGLRVSELVTLPLTAVSLHADPTVHIVGKGRKERQLPIWKQAAADLRSWIAVRGNVPATEFFVNAVGNPLTRGGFDYVLNKHVARAVRTCPSLKAKQVTAHVLRHTCAMMILQATGDLRKVALWLGHADMKTTQIYLRADPTEKLSAVEGITPTSLRRGRFRVPDKLIASLTGG